MGASSSNNNWPSAHGFDPAYLPKGQFKGDPVNQGCVGVDPGQNAAMLGQLSGIAMVATYIQIAALTTAAAIDPTAYSNQTLGKTILWIETLSGIVGILCVVMVSWITLLSDRMKCNLNWVNDNADMWFNPAALGGIHHDAVTGLKGTSVNNGNFTATEFTPTAREKRGIMKNQDYTDANTKKTYYSCLNGNNIMPKTNVDPANYLSNSEYDMLFVNSQSEVSAYVYTGGTTSGGLRAQSVNLATKDTLPVAGAGGSSAPSAFGAICGQLPQKAPAYNIAVNVSTYTFLRRLDNVVTILEFLTYGTIVTSLVGQMLVIYNNVAGAWDMWPLFAVCGLFLILFIVVFLHAKNTQMQVMREAQLDVDYFPYTRMKPNRLGYCPLTFTENVPSRNTDHDTAEGGRHGQMGVQTRHGHSLI